MKTIAYLRVSTEEQDLEKNKADINIFCKNKGLGPPEFIEEKISGTVSYKKRKLFQVLQSLKKNDNLIVAELSRLGRSTLQILEVLELAKSKHINIYAVKGGWQLDNTIQSKIVSTILAMLAEIERDLIAERTKEALRAKKAQGVKLGRPKGTGFSKLDRHKKEIMEKIKTEKKSVVASEYGVCRQTLYHWIKRNKEV